MKNQMMSPSSAAERISTGAILVIAGDETVLRTLPKGNWIGGTSVYFLTEDGGREDRENVFVTELDMANTAVCRHVPTADLATIAEGHFPGGATMVLIPAMSAAHQTFALEGASYPGLFDQPMMGWISGVHLDDLGQVTPKVVDGTTGAVHEDGAVVLYAELDEGLVADINIINLFEPDTDADTLRFTSDGFTADTALVNGTEVKLADYLAEKGIDTRLPLVANYAGAMINVSFQSVDEASGTVAFYAPVIQDTDYRIAKSPGDYATVFAARASAGGANELSCNCILNYLYGELESKKTGSFTGPATFGEIAYVLLNQTMVRLSTKAATATRVA